MRGVGAFVGGIVAAMLAAGCFSDPSEDQACSPGMEGCACVELECEQGLSCMGGVCVAAGGSSGTTDSSTDSTTGVPSTTTGSSDDTTTSGQVSTDTSATTDDPSTTGAADSSTGGDPTGNESSGTTGEVDTCGDFVVGPTEECDGGNGCSDSCELEVHDCNPLNNVPCPAGQKCSWQILQPDPFTGYFTCLPLADEPLADGEGDCFQMNEAQDPLCELGLACFNANFLDGCGSNGCCTAYCNVNDAAPCQTEGYTCVAEPDLAPGLAFLGVCR